MEGFELLLAAATALVRARSARPALLDAYDDASDRLIEGLRGNGIPEAGIAKSTQGALAPAPRVRGEFASGSNRFAYVNESTLTPV